jgi:hypothetical protein
VGSNIPSFTLVIDKKLRPNLDNQQQLPFGAQV